MNDLEISRTPELIGAEIRTLTTQARTITLYYAIEIGRRLVEAKDLCAHGEWLPFLNKETEFSDRTAARYMQAYREYGKDQNSLFGAELNSTTLSNLSVSNALRLLALPEDEREDFAIDNDVEHLSTSRVDELVKQRMAEIEAENKALNLQLADMENKAAVMQGELDASAEELKKSREHIRDLEARPVEVAVERDEAAIAAAADEARAEVSKEYKALILDAEKELKEQKKAVKEATKARDKALKDAAELRRDMEKLKAAPAAEETVEKLRAQYEAQIQDAEKRAAEAEKQLKLADAGIAEFSAAFSRAQSELNAMHTALGRIADGETAAKLRKAACAVLENFAPKFREAQA